MACPLFQNCNAPPGNVMLGRSSVYYWQPFDWLHLTAIGIVLAVLMMISLKIIRLYFGRTNTIGAVLGLAGCFLLCGYASLLVANLVVDYSLDMTAFDQAALNARRDVWFLWTKWFARIV